MIKLKRMLLIDADVALTLELFKHRWRVFTGALCNDAASTTRRPTGAQRTRSALSFSDVIRILIFRWEQDLPTPEFFEDPALHSVLPPRFQGPAVGSEKSRRAVLRARAAREEALEQRVVELMRQVREAKGHDTKQNQIPWSSDTRRGQHSIYRRPGSDTDPDNPARDQASPSDGTSPGSE